MIQLLLIYKWTLLGGILSGGALSLVGSQLAARNQAVQSLVISQSAVFGIVLGLIIQNLLFHDDHGLGFAPLLVGFIVTSLIYFICEKVISENWVSRNTYYIALFSFLMAMTFALISLVPSLDTHMTASYFGDLALASNGEAIVIAILSSAILALTVFNWPALSAWSFETVTFGAILPSKSQKLSQTVFSASTLLLLTVSVQLLGMLFTLSCLFFPVMILSRSSSFKGSLKFYLALSGMLGVALGFLFSLWQGSLPTGPCISVFLVLVASFLVFIKSMRRV